MPAGTVVLGNALGWRWDAQLEFGDGTLANAGQYANQLGADIDVKFDSRSSGYTWLHLLGTDQTIGNVRMGSDSRSWQAVIDQATSSNSYNDASKFLTIHQNVDQTFTGYVRSSDNNSGRLNIRKDGAARLAFAGPTYYDGTTHVKSGILEFKDYSASARYDIDLGGVV